MTEEERLNNYMKVSGADARSPFKVPNGYFDTLCDRVMDRLPQTEEQESHKAKTVRLLPHMWRIVSAAVIVVGLVIGSVMLLPSNSDEQNQQVANQIEQSQTVGTTSAEEAYLNAALDYAMVDNSEIEDYLTE